ncbi:MAG: exodeoxyribonuclease VII large subunit [Gammaproteobacteria bacterium]|nr:exodeoxyribonuclease VII large subunit [Gammaproteobacteria bacterium]MCP5199214.1 exodeoxyribonuclease VII large subunit [Gammaproteobacteria bacterium]
MVRRTAKIPPAGNGLHDIYSVSRLTEAARATLEQGLGRLWVEGEISNLARPPSGHLYFTLKDATAQVRCAMFRNRSSGLRCRPENGLSVLAHGLVSLYPARGDFQLIVDSLEAAGDGLLALRFEELKRKLDAEGLFDAAHKRPLPDWPRAIGIVTSPSGAAVRDIIHVLARRCPSIPVIVYPTLVQGEGAARDIVRAIETANARAECDVLIIGRGGGSLEDLWSFNEEAVARAIHASQIPTVSAVGHEVDVTIADLVADLRAPTPSAAAEVVSPDALAAVRRARDLERRLRNAITRHLADQAREIGHLGRRLVSPQRRLELNFQRVDELSQRLQQATRTLLALRGGHLGTLASRLGATSPAARLRLLSRELVHHERRLEGAMRESLAERARRLERVHDMLQALGPAATLERGYAIVSTPDGAIVRDATTLAAADEVDARLARGSFRARVIGASASDGDDAP